MDINSIIDNIHFQNLTKILKELGERVEGNLICNITPDNYVICNNESKI